MNFRIKKTLNILLIVFIFSIFVFPKASFAEVILMNTNLGKTMVTLESEGLDPSAEVVFIVRTHISNQGKVPYYIEEHTVSSDSSGSASSNFFGLTPGGLYVGFVSYNGATLGTTTFRTFTQAEMVLNFDVTQKSVALNIGNISPNVPIIFEVKNVTPPDPPSDPPTPTYSQSKTETSVNLSTISSNFSDLIAGGHYNASVKYSETNEVLATTNFYTIVDEILHITNVTYNSVTLEAKNVLPSQNIIFEVKNLGSETPTYSQSNTKTSNDAGIALANFFGLIPGGHYTGTIKYSLGGEILRTITFYTFGTLPSPETPNNTNPSQNNSDDGKGLVPCGTRSPIVVGPDGKETGGEILNPCGFKHLMDMVNKVINFILFVLAVPIAAIMFAYAGFLLVFSGGASEKRSKAKSIFINVAIGLVLAVAAWLIVHTILSIVGFDGAWIGL